MAVHHLCQWGFWGISVEESCGEADDSLIPEPPEEALDHESCGWFAVNSVENEFTGLMESTGMSLEGLDESDETR